MTAPVILLEATPKRTSDGAAVTVRLAGGGDQVPYRYGANDWLAGIVQLPTLITSIDFGLDENAGGEFGEGGVPQAIQLQWAPSSMAKLAEIAGRYWFDASITVRIGPEDPTQTLPAITLSGKALSANVSGGVMTIAMSDPAADLKKPLLTARYGGTGDLDGPAEWAGKIKRRVWGRVWNVALEPIDKAYNIYSVADPSKPLQSIDAVRDQGAAAASLTTVAWAGSAAATLAALRAAVAPSGGGCVAPSISCVKWWTVPGALHADVKGEIGSGYVETTAAIVERIVQAGANTPFATGTVAAAAAARPAPVGWMARDDSTSQASMIQELLGNSSLLWLIDSSGKIVLREWAWGASAASAQSLDVKRIRTLRPTVSRQLGYRRNESPMARGDIVASVLATDVTYADGTPVENLKPGESGATRNTYFIASTDPGGGNGSLWKDTSSTPAKFKLKVSGAWVDVSSLVTDTGQISDGAGLGLTALWASVTGSGKPENNATRNNYFVGSSDPGGSDGSLWKDTSTTPARFRLKVSGSWVDVSSLVTDTAQITDGANLGLTAVWGGVTGSGKPEDNATRNTYYVASTDPGGANGSLWKDTSASPPKFKLKVSGAWVDVSSLVTNTNQITDGAGLGLTAQWASISGSGKPENDATKNSYFVGPSDPGGSNGSLWKDTSTTPARFRLKVSGSWVDVSSLVTDTAQITDGANLGLTAVWTGITGSGKPENNADVAADIKGPPELVINADYTGAVTDTMPRDQQYGLLSLGSDVYASATWGVSVLSGTIAASMPSPGLLRVNLSGGVISPSSLLELSAAGVGQTRKYTVKVTRKDAPPPSAGSNGGTANDGGFSGSTTSTTPVAITNPMSCALGSVGTARLRATYEFDTALSSGSQSMTMRWYRWNGAAYVGIGSATAAYQAYVPTGGVPGAGNCDLDQSETAYTIQSYQLYAWNSGGSTGSARNVTGTASAVGT